MKSRSCDDYQELASVFADDQLGAAEISDLHGHLRDCGECRQFLTNVYRVGDFIRAEELRHSPPSPSPHFAAGMAGVLRSEANRNKPLSAGSPAGFFSSSWARFSGAAAAAVLLLTAGWSLHQFSGGGEVQVAVSEEAVAESEEASMASYVRRHALHAMDATYLGFPEGVELARFEGSGTGFE